MKSSRDVNELFKDKCNQCKNIYMIMITVKYRIRKQMAYEKCIYTEESRQ